MNDKMRAEFEMWLAGTTAWKMCEARGKPLSLRCNMDGSYSDYRVNDRWLAWKAALATQQAEGQKYVAVDGSLTQAGQRKVIEHMTVEIRDAMRLLESIRQRAEAIDCQPIPTTQPGGRTDD